MPKFDIPNNRLIRLPSVTVKYRDIFDFRDFYDSLHEWLLEHEWMDSEGEEDHWESHYTEKVDRNGSKEMWIRWRLKKNPPEAKKLLFYWDFDFHIVGLGKAEVVRDNLKLGVNKGEIELIISPSMEEIYKLELGKNNLTKEFLALFAKRIYKKTIDQKKKELYQETYEFQNFVKQWFKLKRYLPYEDTKTFFTAKSWPSHMKE